MELQITDPHYREKSQALTALHGVIDPELYINIVDLGLVYDLDFSNPEEIILTMTLTTPHCPMEEAISNGVENVMTPLFPDRKLNLNIVWEPEWNMSMMSDEAREQLGF